MTLRERLRQLEDLLDELRRANANKPILVEGSNDREALEDLGCSGRILLVHDGDRLVDTADRLARDHQELILLLDWDRTGGSIHHRVKEVLETHAVDVDGRFRQELARLARSEAKTIEEMPSMLRRLRERAGRVP